MIDAIRFRSIGGMIVLQVKVIQHDIKTTESPWRDAMVEDMLYVAKFINEPYKPQQTWGKQP